MATLLLVLDLVGTFVFALSGAMAGVMHRLDLFGVLVLSHAAGNAGGITRDLLIGAVPPGAISDRNQLVIVMMSSQADPLDAELISLTMTAVSHFREIFALSQ